MKSQLDMLESDLKMIQTEFKKKNTQIKDVFKNTLIIIVSVELWLGIEVAWT